MYKIQNNSLVFIKFMYIHNNNIYILGEVDTIGDSPLCLRLLKSNLKLPIINKDKKKEKVNSSNKMGTLNMDSFLIQERHSFLDYIRGGTKVHIYHI